jgi:hypothetical protein
MDCGALLLVYHQLPVQNTPVSDDDMLQIVSESGAQDLL